MPTTRFLVLVYRMPPRPTGSRVAVWRNLKKVGAVYLQQSVCVFPDTAKMRRDLTPILARIETSGGSYHLLPLRSLPASEHEKIVTEFRQQTTKRFDEIIENCEVNFQKELEFETFRKNFTYEEAEEERIEFEKIVAWFNAVVERDWFEAPKREEARIWIDRCEKLLDEFEERVYQAQGEADRDLLKRRSSPRRRNTATLVSARRTGSLG
jgi:hypothetical protein